VNLDWLPPDMAALIEKATESQRVAATLYGEARSEPVQGIIAVANVIRHRIRQPQRFGASPSDVVTRKLQFSCWSPLGGEGNYRRVKALMQQFVDGTQIVDLGARECIGIAQLMLGDYLRDNVKGSCHYHTFKMMPRPAWAEGHTPVAQISGHLFYSDIP
jgi:N-acetylmuramoyl-L-alanine amidase